MTKKITPLRDTKSIRAAVESAMAGGDLGTYLRLARERAGLSQGDVAKALDMAQFQSISQWERNASGSVPIPALRQLITLYGIPNEELYEILLRFQQDRLASKLEKKFFGASRRTPHKG